MRRLTTGQIRIIGGKWRGRTLKVLPQPQLRPTPDRVRETVFNWLAPHIKEARCLDLFAGTGVLGFEALSRGAKRVVFVESHPATLKAIKAMGENLQALSCLEVVYADAIQWLQQNQYQGSPFDIIFLDPPFSSSLLTQSISLLASSALVNSDTWIYLEAPASFVLENLPSTWKILKQKTAGEVGYHLLQGGSA